MYEVCRTSYDRGLDVDQVFRRKIDDLVRQHRLSGGPEASGGSPDRRALMAFKRDVRRWARRMEVSPTSATYGA